MNDSLLGYSLALVVMWGAISLAVLFWYLWAMARLFPKIGLRAGEGWIPLWNEWKLIDRAGLPGWTVVFYLVALGIVPVIMRIIAMHRIGREAGAGAGYTVLGVFIPPLWATLLGNFIGHRVVMPSGSRGRSAASAYAASGAYAPAGAYGAPGAYAAPGTSVQPAAPAAPPQGVAPGYAAPLAAPVAPPAATSSDVPAAPWVADSALPQVSPAPAAPVVPSAPPPLGHETEAEYARLAAESFDAPPSVPFGQAPAPAPFSWTAASRPEPPAPPAPPAAPLPPVHPVAAAPVVVPSVAVPPASPQRPSSPESPFAPPQPANEQTNDPAPAVRKPTGITGMFDQPVASAPVAQASLEQSPVDDLTEVSDGDLDRTVVVARTGTNWVLELPDGSVLPLERDSIVGRRPEAQGAAAITVPDPTRTLSKSHARLRFNGEAWSIEDLGSTNGTVLLGANGHETEVAPGVAVAATERLLLGTLEVRLRPGGESA